MASKTSDSHLTAITDPKIDVIDAFHDVPTADSAANTTIRDVVGNKTDTVAGNSVYATLHKLDDHFHSASKVYPTLAAGVAVATSANAWELGAFVEIVPASTITVVYDIHHISIEALDDNAVYELVLYYGAADTECGRVRFTKTAVMDTTLNIRIQTPLIPANSKIRAKCASSVGNSSATISLKYHTY